VPHSDYDDDGNPDGPTTLLAGLRNGKWLHQQQFAPLRYHIPGIIPEGLTVLAGAPKVGKSWLVLALLLARASGGKALGAIAVPHAENTLYLALEDGDRRMQSRCRTLLRNDWRYDDPIPERFEYMTTITAGQLVATIAEWLQLCPRGLVVVDTLGRVLPPAFQGETPYMRDYRVMSSLKQIADAFPGAALLLNHHDRKAISADFVDSVSGTNGIAGGADSVIVLTRPRDDPAGLLQITGRDVTEAAYALTFERGIWELDGGGLDEAADRARERHAAMGLSDRSADVVAFVARHAATGTRPADVAGALGIDENAARTYLSRLTSAGRIDRATRGVYVPVASDASLRSANDSQQGNTRNSPDTGHPGTSDTPWPDGSTGAEAQP
jgi:AAA domain